MEKKEIRVMVVDDQALVLDILRKGLSKDPMIKVVATATNGRLALNQIDRAKPDVIVLDMEMPQMNGMQFLHELMPTNPIPTVVLSALTHKDSKLTQEAFDAGAIDFISKPSAGARGLQNLLDQLYAKIKMAATQDVGHLKKKAAQKKFVLPPSVLDRKAKVNQSILGMGAYEISKEVGKKLKIFALGSCIGVALFCPEKNIAALSHVALPSSATDVEKAKKMPGYFADTAIFVMVEKLKRIGCPPNKIIAKIAGGAKTAVDIGDFFGVGQRNTVAVKAALLKRGVSIKAEDLGGAISRTVHVEIGSTDYHLAHPDKGKWTI